MPNDVLDRTVQYIKSSPASGQALLLYALLSTLSLEQSGCMFKLVKLREMTPETRELAYGLMELMATGHNHGPEWNGAMDRIHEAVRG